MDFNKSNNNNQKPVNLPHRPPNIPEPFGSRRPPAKPPIKPPKK